MINIDPYIQRLEWLKEWIAIKIDRNMTHTLIISTWERTGMLINITDRKDYTTFESYCKYKQSL